MKIKHLACLAGLLPSGLFAQSIVNTSDFYNPDFKVRRTGATSGLVTAIANNTLVSGSQSSGNSSWTHSAGGFVQSRVGISVPIVGTVGVDAQLAAYTRTVGDTLVFGRELSAAADIGGLVLDLSGVLSNVVGASVLYNWESTETYSNLAIAPEQLYQVDFTVTSGAGLPVNLLSASTFGITTANVTGVSGKSAQLLDLLSLVSLGTSSDTGNFSFQFKSSTALDHLDFKFAATSGVAVTALGTTPGNQNVLTFSNFQVTPVPEPSGVLLLSTAAGLCLMRRKRSA